MKYAIKTRLETLQPIHEEIQSRLSEVRPAFEMLSEVDQRLTNIFEKGYNQTVEELDKEILELQKLTENFGQVVNAEKNTELTNMPNTIIQ